MPDKKEVKVFFKKNKILLLIGMMFLFATIAGCTDDNSQSKATGTTDGEPVPPVPVEIANEEDLLSEGTASKEYEHWAIAYLDVLVEKSKEISSPGIDSNKSAIAILDVFGDETPELLYTYRYDDPDFFDDYDYPVPCWFLEIVSYSESFVIESVFDTCIFFAAGGGNNYCVCLTHKGELMLYRSYFGGGQESWGFWQIVSKQNLETIEEYERGYYSIDLAKLYYSRLYPEAEKIYKSYGEEISKEQYDITAKEIMGDIDRVILQGIDFTGIGLYYSDDLWKDITPFEEVSMTFNEAVAWLEAQSGKNK